MGIEKFADFKTHINLRFERLRDSGERKFNLVTPNARGVDKEEFLVLNKSSLIKLIHVQMYKVFGPSGKWYVTNESGEFEKYEGELLKKSSQWEVIFRLIHARAGISWPRQRTLDLLTINSNAVENAGYNLFKSFASKDSAESALACYYWFHTYNKHIEGKVFPYPFKEYAHTIDNIVFDGDTLDDEFEILSHSQQPEDANKRKFSNLKSREPINQSEQPSKLGAEAENIQKNNPTFSPNKRGLSVSWSELTKAFEICERDGGELLEIQDDSESIRLNNSASLLSWQSYLSSFVGRESQLKELDDWMNKDRARKSIKLVYGEGGVGKTRLAFHFAKKQKRKGWNAGELISNFEGTWQLGKKGIFFIIDYPEERTEIVSKFLRALSRAKIKSNNKVRVLLLSRGRNVLESISENSSRLRHDSMFLEGFSDYEEAWNLYKKTSKRLKKLDARADNLIKNASKLKPLFKNWLQISPQHRTPLIINALAIYTYNKPELIKRAFLDLNSAQLIRTLSIREERRIRNELENLNQNLKKQFIDERLILLLCAVSSITDGISPADYSKYFKWLKKNYKKHNSIKMSSLCETSIYSNGLISPIKPDLFAADFLFYILKKWALGEEKNWILYTAGDTDIALSNEKLKAYESERIRANYSRLNRLYRDARVKLDIDIPKDILSELINRRSKLNPINNTGKQFDMYESCLKWTDYDNFPPMRLFEMSLVFYEQKQIANSLHSLEICTSILGNIYNEDIDRFGPIAAVSFSVKAVVHREALEYIPASKAEGKAIEVFTKCEEKTFADYGCFSLLHCCFILNLKNDFHFEYGLKKIKEIVDFSEGVFSDKDIKNTGLFVDSSRILSLYYRKCRDFEGAYFASEKSVFFAESRFNKNPSKYKSEFIENLIVYSLNLFDLNKVDSAIVCIEEAIQICSFMLEKYNEKSLISLKLDLVFCLVLKSLYCEGYDSILAEKTSSEALKIFETNIFLEKLETTPELNYQGSFLYDDYLNPDLERFFILYINTYHRLLNNDSDGAYDTYRMCEGVFNKICLFKSYKYAEYYPISDVSMEDAVLGMKLKKDGEIIKFHKRIKNHYFDRIVTRQLLHLAKKTKFN